MRIAGVRVGFRETITRQHLIVVLQVHHDGQADLFGVGETGDLAGLGTGLREDGKQNGSQNCNDGNDDKQLNQGKAFAASEGISIRFDSFRIVSGPVA